MPEKSKPLLDYELLPDFDVEERISVYKKELERLQADTKLKEDDYMAWKTGVLFCTEVLKLLRTGGQKAYKKFLEEMFSSDMRNPIVSTLMSEHARKTKMTNTQYIRWHAQTMLERRARLARIKKEQAMQTSQQKKSKKENGED